MCKFTLTCLQIICKNFFAKLVQSVSLCHRLSKKAKFYQNLTTESGSKKRFSLLQEKSSVPKNRQLVLKPGFRSKGRALGMQEKSENFNSLRPILFELCKKKITTGGGKIDPPPSTNRVKGRGGNSPRILEPNTFL